MGYINTKRKERKYLKKISMKKIKVLIKITALNKK